MVRVEWAIRNFIQSKAQSALPVHVIDELSNPETSLSLAGERAWRKSDYRFADLFLGLFRRLSPGVIPVKCLPLCILITCIWSQMTVASIGTVFSARTV